VEVVRFGDRVGSGRRGWVQLHGENVPPRFPFAIEISGVVPHDPRRDQQVAAGRSSGYLQGVPLQPEVAVALEQDDERKVPSIALVVHKLLEFGKSIQISAQQSNFIFYRAQ